MVEMIDGSVIAEMAIPDMAIPVAYALAFPERLPMTHLQAALAGGMRRRSLSRSPTSSAFRVCGWRYEALAAGGTMPALPQRRQRRAGRGLPRRATCASSTFPRHIETVMGRHHESARRARLEDLLETDGWARRAARELMGGTARATGMTAMSDSASHQRAGSDRATSTEHRSRAAHGTVDARHRERVRVSARASRARITKTSPSRRG